MDTGIFNILLLVTASG